MSGWTFDGGTEGWTVTTGTLTWQGTGGVDGNGYLQVDTEYTLGSYLGGTVSPGGVAVVIVAGQSISFSLRNTVVGYGLSVTLNFTDESQYVISPVLDTENVWQTYDYPLDDYVGKEVNNITIEVWDTSQTLDIDNISFSEPPSPKVDADKSFQGVWPTALQAKFVEYTDTNSDVIVGSFLPSDRYILLGTYGEEYDWTDYTYDYNTCTDDRVSTYETYATYHAAYLRSRACNIRAIEWI